MEICVDNNQWLVTSVSKYFVGIFYATVDPNVKTLRAYVSSTCI